MLSPKIAVFPQKTTPGANTVAEIVSAPLFAAKPWREVFEAHYDTDAHASTYTLPGEDEWCRINKPCITELRARGVDPEVWLTVLDWDNEGHKALLDAEFVGIRHQILNATPAPTLFYRTAGGCRSVFVHGPVTLEDSEALHRGLCAHFAAQGITYDTTVWDWTRLFRLPFVMRDGAPTQTLLDWGPELDHAPIPRIEKPRRDIDPETLDLELPPNPETLVWKPAARPTKTTWATEAFKRLAWKDCGIALRLEPFLVAQNAPAIPDERNTTLTKMLGCAAAVCYDIPGTTPAHIFATFLPAIEASVKPEDPGNGRNLAAEGWRIAKRVWAYEDAKRLTLEDEREDLEASLLGAMRKWPTPPLVPDEGRLEWLQRHAVLSVGKNYFVRQRNGWYSPAPLLRDHIFAGLRDSGTAEIVPLTVVTKDGTVKQIGATAILNNYHTPLSRGAVAFANVPGGPEGAGWFEGETFYRCPYYRRTDIKPEFNPHVDAWLRATFGKHYDFICKWIGLALAFERGPICILSIMAPDGVGKGMLIQGLAECINTKVYVTGRMFAQWQDDLDRTPFIAVNEGWPPEAKGIANTVREIVGGGHQFINKKYMHLEHCETNPRVILTANNRSAVQKLFSQDQLGVDDLAAVAKRVTHIELDSGGREHLERLGQKAHTAGWIADAGFPSRWTLAKHFLWLYQKHGQKGGTTRFLIDGQTEPELLWQISLAQGQDSEVGYWLVKWLNANSAKIDKGEIKTTAEKVCEYYSQQNQFQPYRTGVPWFGRRMVQFCKGEAERGERNLDLPKLEAVAKALGLECKWSLAERRA